MKSVYNRYPDMVESGVEWLGDTPMHWGVVQSRRLFSERKERIRLGDQHLTPSQKYGVIPQVEYMELEGRRLVLVHTGSDILKHAEPDDFIISMRSFEGGLEWCGYRGSISSAYVAIIPIKHVVPRFFRYLFKSTPYIQALQRTSNLIREGQALRFQNFSLVPLPLIPDEEQTQIARFLDYETAKIDTLIEKQQELIALLEEKRQAVISHAVTKGLNPDVPMRDSGIEWLGEVPTHWNVAPIKHHFGSLDHRRIPLSTIDRGKRPGPYPYYGASGIIDQIDGYIFDEPTVLVGEDGANLVNRSTPLAFPAFGQYWVNNHAHVLRPPDQATHYWAEAIEHIDVNPLVTGSAQPKLTADALMNLKIVFAPCGEERMAIQEFVLEKKKRFGALAERALQQVEILQEKRAALISAAVTGNIDLRNWTPPESEPAAETS